MGIIPAIKKGKQRLLISGYDQISAVSDWFIDNKGKKVADYLKSAVRKINKRRLNAIPAVEVKEVITKFRNVPVYSVEVADNHTFAVAQGIYVHNCIPLDPFYLEYVAKKYHFDLTMIHTAGQINTLMPHRMMVKINTALNKHKKSINGSKILFMGVAYKANINDERESPALRVIDEVARKGAVVSYHDPHIPSVKTEEGRILKSVELSDSAIASADCVVFTTAHTAFNVENIVNKAKLIVDLRNVVKSKSDKVTKL